MQIVAVDQPSAPALEVPERFRTEIVFFMTPPGERGAPAPLADGDYWIDPGEARGWLDDFVVRVVSPLDAQSQAEIELTDYHEAFLQWLLAHNVRHVRLK
jgi:hypothetical protein